MYLEMKMSDKEIVEALVSHDREMTELFFFKHCKPLFMSIIKNVFSYDVDYDEFVDELYLYLMENDACRLRQFEGRSSIYQWLKITAIRYFILKRDNMIEMNTDNSLNDIIGVYDDKDEERRINAQIDVENLFRLMSNKRYVYVIRRLVLDDAEPKDVALELGISIDNLYNIKKRAIKALTEIALKEFGKYEK